MIPRRIVAEISRNWPSQMPRKTIGKLFEETIDFYLERGFDLERWEFQSLSWDPGTFTETIIAVFVDSNPPQACWPVEHKWIEMTSKLDTEKKFICTVCRIVRKEPLEPIIDG